jgi:hypothetical protein
MVCRLGRLVDFDEAQAQRVELRDVARGEELHRDHPLKLNTDDVFRRQCWLIKNGVPFNVARSLDYNELLAHSVTFSRGRQHDAGVTACNHANSLARPTSRRICAS